MKWWCDKDLYMEDGELSFKKDHLYIVKSYSANIKTATLIDEQGCDHIVSGKDWYFNFSKLKGILRNL